MARLAISLPGENNDNLPAFPHSFKILNGFLEALVLKVTPERPLPTVRELPRAGVVGGVCRKMR